MDRRKLSWITWVFVVLTVLVLVMMLMDTLHGPDGMVLPDTSTTSGQTGEIPTPDGALAVVEVSPSTVQAAVKTLARPEAYRRTVTVEQLWSGGSSSYEIAMAVSGPWTRTDRTMPDGRVRHTITGPEDVYIWYNNEAAVYTSPVGDITADHELPIPTYEDILSLDVEAIIAADYRTISNVACIYAGGPGQGSIPCVLDRRGQWAAGGGGKAAGGRDSLPDAVVDCGSDRAYGGGVHIAGRNIFVVMGCLPSFK